MIPIAVECYYTLSSPWAYFAGPRIADIAIEKSEPVVAEYRRNSDELEQRGSFGSPTYVLNGELFWGQDRQGFLDRALAMLRTGSGDAR